MKKLNASGFNLVELSIAILILAAMAGSIMMARTFMAKQTTRTSDKAYATQKAIQMFEELRALVNGNEKAGVSVLDDYSDGSQFNTVLTTDKTVDTAPPSSGKAGDPLSGNRTTNGHWRYVRQIQVNRLANDPYSREVFIKVYRYATDSNPTQPGELLASIGGILRTITSLFPPTQVIDVYVLAVNNVQAWWAILPTLSNTMQGIIGDIQGRNPGLQIKTHMITRLSYGRDPQYIPYINSTTSTNALTEPYVYFYPGLSPQDTGSGPFFDPGGVVQDGLFNVDNSVTHPSSAYFPTCPDWAVCDQSNHAVRYPDELIAYQAVTQAWWSAITSSGAPNYPKPEISERMLIEGMNSSPASFTNSLIINMHGELEPLPPMRNYSDAAKDPGGLTGGASPAVYPSPNQTFNAKYVRATTHPELLYYPGTSPVNVNLRVYSYYDGFQDVTTLSALGADPRLPAMSVYLPDVNVTPTMLYISGNSSAITYQRNALAVNTICAVDAAVSWTLSHPTASSTLVTLYNSPLRCPNGPSTSITADNNGGLNTNDLLYGLEYIPCSPEISSGSWGSFPTTFTFTIHDLAWDQNPGGAPGTNNPKNTARWVITLPSVPLGQHIIETFLGANQTSNIINGSTVPSDISKTYVWVGNNNTPPFTEQFQYLGDPRHMPYLDCKVGGPTGGSITVPSDCYNWYFKDLHNTTASNGYSGFGKANGGWSNGIENDIPKYDWAIRRGLLNSTSTWTTLNGFSFYYYGIGGEWGFDHPPYNDGVTLNQTIYSTTTNNTYNSTGELQNVPWGGQNGGNVNVGYERVVSNTVNTWNAKYWMGELYPDSQATNWAANGNLSTAGGTADTAHFYRRQCGAITGANSLTGFRADFDKVQKEPGCSSFFNAGDTTSHYFMHDYYDNNTGNRQSLATTCYGIFQYNLPSVVNLYRPWCIDSTGPYSSPERGSAPYNTTGTGTGAVRPYLVVPNFGVNGAREFYNTGDSNGGGVQSSSNTWYGAGVVEIRDKSSSPTQRAYVNETGTSPSANVGSQDLAETALVETLRTFLDGGQVYPSGTAGHIPQIPIVELYTQAVPQFSAPTSISLVIASPVTTGIPVTYGSVGLTIASGPSTNVWFRYSGTTSNTANYYTEEYPNYGSPLTATGGYTESVSLVYNLKYSYDTGKHWRFMQDNNSAVTGICDLATAHAMTVTNSNPVTWYSLSTPSGVFPQGDYWLMVEAYRQDPASGNIYTNHYSYHILDVTINR